MRGSETLARAIDGAIGLAAPMTALKRSAARAARRILMSGSYKAADTGRLRGTWFPGGGSADADILDDLPTMRERSRDLIRNDGYAAGIVSNIVTNVIGTGIKPQSRIDAEAAGLSAERADELARAMEREWRQFVQSADAAQHQDFYGLQRLAFRQTVENGESLALIVMVDGKPRCHVIESDRLGNPYGYTPTPIAANLKDELITTRSGVEIGDYGEPIRYFIRKRHPGDSGNLANPAEYETVAARDKMGRPLIIHFFRKQRAGQRRGVPWLAPVLSTFKDLGEYLEAELVAARVAACFALFVRNNDPVGAANAAYDLQGNTNARGATQRLETLEPGMIRYLGLGEDITGFTPNRPGVTFDAFMMRLLRAICAALDLPYEEVAKDYSQANYSSMRAGKLDTRKVFRSLQAEFARQFCQPFWDWKMEEAWLAGRLGEIDFYGKREALLRAQWIADGWEWVDPLKEVQGDELALKNNFTTLADVLGGRGQDWEEVLAQRARETERIKELGLAVEMAEPSASSGSAADDDAEEMMTPARRNGNGASR